MGLGAQTTVTLGQFKLRALDQGCDKHDIRHACASPRGTGSVQPVVLTQASGREWQVSCPCAARVWLVEGLLRGGGGSSGIRQGRAEAESVAKGSRSKGRRER